MWNVSSLDQKIPFRPKWVWLYSGLYYPYVLSIIPTLSNMNDFYSTCMSYVVLLFSHVTISYLFPIKTPANWRSYGVSCASSWTLRFIQRIDKGGNCFPSMHVAVATLTAIHIIGNGYYESIYVVAMVCAVPALVAVSALFTKQHYVADIVPGVLLAFFAYGIYRYPFGLPALENSKSLLFAFVIAGFFLFFLTSSQAQSGLYRTVAGQQTAPSRRAD